MTISFNVLRFRSSPIFALILASLPLGSGLLACSTTLADGVVDAGPIDPIDAGDNDAADEPAPVVPDAGRSDSGKDAAPTSVGALQVVVASDLGKNHACAARTDGSVKCWGTNSSGELGLGDTRSRGARPGEMGAALAALDLGPGRTAQQVAVGASRSCALLSDGSVRCWGAEQKIENGGLYNVGDGPGEMGAALQAIDFGVGIKAKQLALGGTIGCAVVDDDTVRCWGSVPAVVFNYNPLTPIALGGTPAVRVARGAGGASFAILSDGDLWSWGTGYSGIFGRVTATTTVPGRVLLGTGDKVVKVAAGDQHACAILQTGNVKCWGYHVGAGNGDTVDRGTTLVSMGDALPTIDLGGRKAIDIAAGVGTTYVVFEDGSIGSWGSNDLLINGSNDVIGDAPGEMGNKIPLLPAVSGEKALSVSVGLYFACATYQQGTVRCWGYNQNGELGQGDTRSRFGASSPLPTVDLGP